ncbi:RIP metalloprotease RseP [Sphingomonas sp. AR_OL41]|uniref:RIP metalloprotease RseP n=1 Tax=Sphingomonas sp. AR_OL41 TaxID=3042729 RepID=UPI0024818558|nr:RIP metalloprotease RseP [Sphingomonas sp. AR_OL41]MDH7970814.1 RIP metalloprotease RseP [Sphingomonas sp. AR_OL41]
MIHNPGFLFTVMAFALVIGPLIFVHEMGHYLAGRLFGTKIDAFSIGFGPEVAGWTDRRGTRWKLSAFPLGGYVKFAGDMNAASQPDPAWLELPAEERAMTLPGKPVWQRAIIVAAGPVVNLLLAVAILAGFAFAYGENVTPSVVGAVQKGSAAATAGLQPGDRIIAIAGRKIETYVDIKNYVVLRPAEQVTIDFMRAGQTRHADVTIGAQTLKDNFGNVSRIGLLGIVASAPVSRPVSLVAAPFAGLRAVRDILGGQIDAIGQIITGRRSVDELGGPLKIAQYSGQQFSLGTAAVIWFIAMISINLGFINLLPIPMLDGGHLLFYAIEAVRRRPVEPSVQEWAFRGGLAAILALMLLVTFNDLGSFGLWKLTGLIG